MPGQLSGTEMLANVQRWITMQTRPKLLTLSEEATRAIANLETARRLAIGSYELRAIDDAIQRWRDTLARQQRLIAENKV